jgi:hypothetical protein
MMQTVPESERPVRPLGDGLPRRAVKIAMPPEPGTDFNAVLLGRGYNRATGAHDA